ncbi:hypothetical protein BDV98DRAFT_559969 [Pterulicium gracile]|uniref:Protein byr4 n=1 Tax=Pterulicium gracile TaxID=1884261 RepID=A0A5C3QXP8_9AGAR|nr:hypothetical protein BDV98DRAFT_559969 [Pterula gracilis]
MPTIPAPSSLPREEWPDADFDLPEGHSIHDAVGKEDEEEDWDLDMDIGKTGGARAQAVFAGMAARRLSNASHSAIAIIRPPLYFEDDEDDDEGVSTIKVSVLPKPPAPPAQSSSPDFFDDDLESAFSLPSDLTQLSLRPLSLSHRSSKNSLEWGDKDHTSSSQSSDAYSSLGFAEASPSSNSTSSISLPESGTDDDDDFDDLEGLVIPSGLFETDKGGRQLNKILEMKKKTPVVESVSKVASPEDDFEMGLVFDDDVDLSPSRLLNNVQHSKIRSSTRSYSMPTKPSSTLRPPSRKASDRAKSPTHPPTSSKSQFSKLRLSPSPPLKPVRSQTFQSFGGSTSPTPKPLSSAPASSATSSFLASKPGSLRGQKSTSVLSGSSPPPTFSRKLTRKASLSSLMGSSPQPPQPSGSGSGSGSSKLPRYEEPTAASKAKAHRTSSTRVQDYKVPPTRPTTPSSNPTALRLTMPTLSRNKSRPSLSSVFSGPSSAASAAPSPVVGRNSPITIPPRPSSTSSSRASTRTPSNPPPPAPKVLRRPKRQRTYGDGTELDEIDDLPTDRDKEVKYRVQPKGYGNRIPGGSYPSKLPESNKGTIRRKRREPSGSTDPTALGTSTNTLKLSGRFEFPSQSAAAAEALPKKRKSTLSSPNASISGMKRKPTLIRNLGGSAAPKVVGDMKWNPQTLRWEGNDHILRDFDATVGTSTRPALITHLTGSSIGSPVGSFASGARIVGNMIFDPTRMCWISTLPPDEEEPDVFANLADDEEEESSWEGKGGTIRANVQALGAAVTSGAESSSSLSTNEAPSPARSHTRTISECGSDRGSRASVVYDVDEHFVAKCYAAEERHEAEIKGWRTALSKRSRDPFSEPDRSFLHDIRALATRKY